MKWALFLLLFIYHLDAVDVELDAKSAILMNSETGRVLYEKRAYAPAYPASVTKVGTALHILDEKGLDFEGIIRPTWEALKVVVAQDKHTDFNKHPPYILEHDGVSLGLKRGEEVPYWAAFYGMLISSANDCANALAEYHGGTIPSYLEELNSYLKKIGCKGTNFTNPHGLHHPEHITTAYDLAKMTQRALSIPLFREIVSSVGFTYPETNKSKAKDCSQGNRLIKPSSNYYYPNALGVKTGYTKAAGNNLIAAAKRDGRELIAVLLGCSSRTSRYQDAIKLFDTFFAEKQVEKRILSKDKSFVRELQGGDGPLITGLGKELTLSYYPSESPKKIRACIHWKELSLPIKQGDLVGEIKVYDGDVELLSEPLYAKESIGKSFSYQLKELFSWFSSSK